MQNVILRVKAELQAILAAVKESPDGEFITVETKDETVQAAKKGSDLLLKVEEVNRHGTTTVDMTTKTRNLAEPMAWIASTSIR